MGGEEKDIMLKPMRNTITGQAFTLAFFVFISWSLLAPPAILADNSDTTDPVARIIGGTKSEDGTWPWIAALITRGADAYQGQFCGGTLIDEEWVVTASHCTEDLTASQIDVLLGQYDLNGSGGTRIEVDQIIMHPNYNSTTYDNDIALLHLSTAATQETAPLLYASQSDLAAAGTSAWIMGWGNTSTTGTDYPSDLMEVQITILSDEYAESVFGSAFTSNMIAAGEEEGGVDSCQGDSGGPMVVADEAGTGWILTGITSWGYGCAEANSPGVYAKVENYTDWIEAMTGITGTDDDTPGAVTLTSPSGTITETSPTYTWTEDSNATWYKLFVWDSAHTVEINTWYEATEVCTSGSCSVTPDTTLTPDSYEGYLKSWNESGSIWGSGTSFTVEGDSTTPELVTLVSPSGTVASGADTFVWTEDANATWYKLYVNNTSGTYVFSQWYEIEDNFAGYPQASCSDGQCSVTLDTALDADSYEWYIKGWNDEGPGPWTDATSFTVSE